MSKGFLRELHISDLFVKIPIVQGGMGVGVSMSGLASAVANEGGIGVISAAATGIMEQDGYTDFLDASKRRLKAEIRWIRSLQRIPKWQPMISQSETTLSGLFLLCSIIWGPRVMN